MLAARIEQELERPYSQLFIKKHEGKVRIETLRVEEVNMADN